MITQTIKFTTTSANTDLFNVTAVKTAIKTVLGLDDTAYNARIALNPITNERMGFTMTFDLVLDTDSVATINGANPQNMVAGAAYSNTFSANIWSIVLGSASTGTITMNITR